MLHCREASTCACLPVGSAGELHFNEGYSVRSGRSGKEKGVQINLLELGEPWEDIYYVLISESRKHEPTVDWEELKAEIK
jgi:hypothetical protein